MVYCTLCIQFIYVNKELKGVVDNGPPYIQFQIQISMGKGGGGCVPILAMQNIRNCEFATLGKFARLPGK